MVKLSFVYKKEELLEIYKAGCEFWKVPFDLKDFLKNYPETDDINIPFFRGMSRTRFIELWKEKEDDVIAEIERVYKPFPEGEVVIGLFPRGDIFWKFKTQKSYSIPGFDNKKALIALVPGFDRFKWLVHELFHANDDLRMETGLTPAEKHQWFDNQAQEIANKYFKIFFKPKINPSTGSGVS